MGLSRKANDMTLSSMEIIADTKGVYVILTNQNVVRKSDTFHHQGICVLYVIFGRWEKFTNSSIISTLRGIFIYEVIFLINIY